MCIYLSICEIAAIASCTCVCIYEFGHWYNGILSTFYTSNPSLETINKWCGAEKKIQKKTNPVWFEWLAVLHEIAGFPGVWPVIRSCAGELSILPTVNEV